MRIGANSCCNWPNYAHAARKLENLEQLAYSRCHSIAVGIVDEPTIGIDTPEDYHAFVERDEPTAFDTIEAVLR